MTERTVVWLLSDETQEFTEGFTNMCQLGKVKGEERSRIEKLEES